MANITKEQADAIWVQHFGDVKWAKDRAGAWICRENYGITRELGYGWEIDHKVPVAKGGTDSFCNLRPLQWENNRSKSDNYPEWSSQVTSENDHNIYRKQTWSFGK